jgi:hypothetical protein
MTQELPIAADETAERDGIVLRGQFIDGRDGREWTGKDGKTRQPYEVTILVGRSAFRVEFRGPQEAAFWLAGAGKGDRVELPVFVRAFKDNAFYRGLGLPQSSEDEAAA